MKILLLNQAFYPDVVSTAQYLRDLALGLVERGHQVSVLTSDRAYDHPERRFPKRELWRGVTIHRISATGFGKGAKWKRAADFGSFTVHSGLRLAFLPRHDVVVALTTPPLIAFLGAWVAWWRGSRFIYWVMDFNPDEAIAAGWLRAGSLPARALDSMSRFSLRRAARIIALDRFMHRRIEDKGIPAEKIAVIPPWPHDDHVRFDAAARARFRQTHHLDNKFVVMYAGNHSPVHSLETLLAAAERLRGETDIVFCFIGGGSEWRKINENQPAGGLPGLTAAASSGPAILCLPYQPLDELAGSLSAADLHVVVMGDAMLGLVHPCKIYNILSVGAPVLYIGPQPSHVTEIFQDGIAPTAPAANFAAAGHGDVEAVVQHILRLRQAALLSPPDRKAIADTVRPYRQEVLLGQLMSQIEI